MAKRWFVEEGRHMAVIWSVMPRARRVARSGARRRALATSLVTPRSRRIHRIGRRSQIGHIAGIWHALMQSARTLLGQSQALSGGIDHSSSSTAAFDRLFEQQEQHIFGYLYRMTGDRHLAS